MKLKLAVLLVAATLAVPAAAQTSSSTSGVVVSSTTESLVVRMDDGTERTFNVTSTTNLPSARLAEGNRVTVQYRPLDAGLFEAARVELATALNRNFAAPTPTPDRSMTTETTQTRAETEARARQNQKRSMATETTRTQNETDARNRQNQDRSTTTDTRSANQDQDNLPGTASPLPLLALSGAAALIAGLLLKARRTA